MTEPDGPRPVWLFLPGMMCDERLFAAQIRYLGHAIDARVARFDVGQSIDAFAEHALALVPENRRVTLVGLSMGGIVAMACLRIAPDRIAGLVLMDTNPLSEVADRRSLRGPQIERVLDGELDAVLIEEMKPAYLAPGNAADETLLELVLDMARSLGAEAFARQSTALAARPDYSSTLAAWRGPSLIVCGRHDALCPPARHELMASLIEGARLEIVEQAGHLVTLEAPAVVNGLLEGVLSAQRA